MLTDFKYATPSPAACPACDFNSPLFLNTKEVPMRTPEPTARMMPTDRYCVGCEDVDVAELVAEDAADDIDGDEREEWGAENVCVDIAPPWLLYSRIRHSKSKGDVLNSIYF